MPSILPGYEYDIFISYRQNDNQDGWVTEFVETLKREIKATFKEMISIYFDENPNDGLHDHHEVDDSLREKLKCLIFIPIVSQTYCDPKSFAWQHEFKVFIEHATNDQFGLKTKLSGGNVASRVLPVKIHDLDTEDQRLFESEAGGVMRSIDFIYKDTGVNRPLSQEDSKEENLKNTRYKDQINKVANAIKQITSGIKGGESIGDQSAPFLEIAVQSISSKPNRIASKIFITFVSLILVIAFVYLFYISKNDSAAVNKPIDKSIAVLPFRNDSDDPNNVYFCNGLMEDIINQLSKTKEIRVPSSTSMIYYRDNPKPYSEIVEELQVSYLLEGSVRKSENEALMSVTLIDAIENKQLWTNRYQINLSIEKLWEVQYDIASEISKLMELSILIPNEKLPTNNYEAYDLYLKGRDFHNKWDIESNYKAVKLLRKAIALDPKFEQAIVTLSQSYGQKVEFENTSIDSAKYFAEKAISLNPENEYAIINLGYIHGLMNDFKTGLNYYLQAYEMNSSLQVTDNNFAGWCYFNLGDNKKAFDWALMATLQNPNNVIYYIDACNVLTATGLFNLSESYAKKVLDLNPLAHWGYQELIKMANAQSDFERALSYADTILLMHPNEAQALLIKGTIHMQMGNLDQALDYLKNVSESGLNPSFLEYYQSLIFKSYTYQQIGMLDSAEVIFKEVNTKLLSDEYFRTGYTYEMMAQLNALEGNLDQCLANLKTAIETGRLKYYNILQNPLYDKFRTDEGFKNVIASYKNKLDDDKTYILQKLEANRFTR